MLTLLQMQQEAQGRHLFKMFVMVLGFLNHKFEQKPCCTLNVTARQKVMNLEQSSQHHDFQAENEYTLEETLQL